MSTATTDDDGRASFVAARLAQLREQLEQELEQEAAPSVEPASLHLRVENLGVAFHKHTKVRFTYHSEPTRSTILVSGRLEKITRGAPGQPTILKVDRLFYAVPPGTVITVETGELR